MGGKSGMTLPPEILTLQDCQRNNIIVMDSRVCLQFPLSVGPNMDRSYSLGACENSKHGPELLYFSTQTFKRAQIYYVFKVAPANGSAWIMPWFNCLLCKLLVSTVESPVATLAAVFHRLLESIRSSFTSLLEAFAVPWSCSDPRDISS